MINHTAARLSTALVALWCVACEPTDLLQIVAEESFADDDGAGDGAAEAAAEPASSSADVPPPEDGGAPAECDPELVSQLSAFMVEFCTRVRRANGKYIEQHVALPLTATVWDATTVGEQSVVEVTYRNAWEFKESGICADLTWLGCGLGVVPIEGGWRVTAGHGAAAIELDFEPLGERFRLIGLRPATGEGGA